MRQSTRHIAAYLPTIQQLCALYGVEKLYLFGSILTDRFDRDKISDVDILIQMPQQMPPIERGENILGLWNDLESLFNRPVDLITTTQLKNPYLIQTIDSEKVLIYDRESQKISV